MSSYAVVEASASGIPVVASNIAGITDLVRDGITGYLIAPGDSRGFIDALSRLISSPDLRRSMGASAQAFAAKCFDARTNFNRLIDDMVSLATEATPTRQLSHNQNATTGGSITGIGFDQWQTGNGQQAHRSIPRTNG